MSSASARGEALAALARCARADTVRFDIDHHVDFFWLRRALQRGFLRRYGRPHWQWQERDTRAMRSMVRRLGRRNSTRLISRAFDSAPLVDAGIHGLWHVLNLERVLTRATLPAEFRSTCLSVTAERDARKKKRA